ncbi:MAG TPA: tetratricopeptide repeat protein [Vicinamibacterales bacterium]|nr:tetratricopeptide repeat protein [Vicinamibacterales bacterium]
MTATALLLNTGRAPVPPAQTLPLTFADLLHEYRRGDADRALQIFSTWTDKRVKAEAKLPSDEKDPWSRAALALFLSELSAFPEAPPPPGVTVVRMDYRVAAFERAIALMGEACDAAKAVTDRELLTLCRDYYLVGLPFSWGFGVDIESQVRKRFSNDPLARLELGKRGEMWTEVIPDSDHDGYSVLFKYDVMGTSSHGAYSSFAAEAMKDFRRALELDPTLVEARVRLGHVLWFLDRREEAQRELLLAAQEAKRTQTPTLSYLANLFLGRLYEEMGQPDAAREAYEEAVHLYPTGQVARLALGRVLVATGREADGWDITARALDPQTWDHHAPDPWRVYYFRQNGAWLPDARYEALRPRVRR